MNTPKTLKYGGRTIVFVESKKLSMDGDIWRHTYRYADEVDDPRHHIMFFRKHGDILPLTDVEFPKSKAKKPLPKAKRPARKPRRKVFRSPLRFESHTEDKRFLEVLKHVRESRKKKS